jgi:hypothetical protein
MTGPRFPSSWQHNYTAFANFRPVVSLGQLRRGVRHLKV